MAVIAATLYAHHMTSNSYPQLRLLPPVRYDPNNKAQVEQVRQTHLMTAPPQYAQQASQVAASGMNGLPPPYGREEALMEQFRAIAQRYEISDYFSTRLKELEGFEIVLILDDSGSMATPLKAQTGGPFAPSVTRWAELKSSVSIIVDIAAVMDKDGLDIYFLNRATMSGVTSSAQLNEVFSHPPGGMTPITPVLRHVLQAKKQISQEKKVLIIIATDGQPTNERGDVDTESLRQVLLRERDPSRVFVTFLACTDDDSTMEYLNGWDNSIPSLDVVDDYVSERAEVLKAQGPNFQFSFGNYIVKTLLGSILPEFDQLDEVKGGCCAIQ